MEIFKNLYTQSFSFKETELCNNVQKFFISLPKNKYIQGWGDDYMGGSTFCASMSSEPQHLQKIPGVAYLVIQSVGRDQAVLGQEKAGGLLGLSGQPAQMEILQDPGSVRPHLKGTKQKIIEDHVMSFWPLCMCMHGACVHTSMCANTHTPQIHTFIKQIKTKQATNKHIQTSPCMRTPQNQRKWFNLFKELGRLPLLCSSQ